MWFADGRRHAHAWPEAIQRVERRPYRLAINLFPYRVVHEQTVALEAETKMDSADRGQSRNYTADLTEAPLSANAAPHRRLAGEGRTRHYAPMPLNVELRDEHGAAMAQIVGVTGPWTLPSVVENDRSMIRFVDPYGDTIFNHLQPSASGRTVHRVDISVVRPSSRRVHGD
jgi:hypothetical protein